jgi:histidinol-phosphatase (PHP family)
MLDFHAHCDYSIDAQGTVDQYACAALRAGLSHICFTTHCDLDPTRLEHDGKVKLGGMVVDVNSAWVESYIAETRTAGERYAAQGLKVLCGLEIGYVPGIEPLIEETTRGRQFDYVLGGVHTLSGIDIVSPRECALYFGTRTAREVCAEYFAYLGGAVSSGLFDCIAHIDIYKRCGLEILGEPLKGAHVGFIRPVLDEIARRDICLEVNSAGLRRGLGSPYPSLDILEEARAAGVRHLTVGSDCHRPEDVGEGIGSCLRLARRAGYEGVAVFEARKRATLSIEELQGCR